MIQKNTGQEGQGDGRRDGLGQFRGLYFSPNRLEIRSPRHSHIEIVLGVLKSASEQLQSKLSNQENEKNKNRTFLGEIASPLITWAAVAATYASLFWGAIMLWTSGGFSYVESSKLTAQQYAQGLILEVDSKRVAELIPDKARKIACNAASLTHLQKPDWRRSSAQRRSA